MCFRSVYVKYFCNDLECIDILWEVWKKKTNSKLNDEKHWGFLNGNDNFHLRHSVLHLIGYFRPWASRWEAAGWEQRAPLDVHSGLEEGRLQDYHLFTPAYTFPPTRAALLAHGVAEDPRPRGSSQPSPVPSCYCISRENSNAVTTYKLCAKPFPLCSPPQEFSDVWLRPVPSISSLQWRH